MRLNQVVIRGLIGPLFVGHGCQKLFGWFGGYGIEGTAGAFEQMGLRPGKRHATAAGAAEALGGLLLTLGAFTPVAASTVTATMVTAIRKAHGKNGLWAPDGGFEYNLVLMAAMASVTDSGPGPLSVDSKLLPEFHGKALALAQLVAGAAGSFLATSPVLTEQEEAPAEGESDTPGDPASNGANASAEAPTTAS
jgi:putative oxidoreductase